MVIVLIFYKNGKWHICTEKVHYTQHGEEITQYVGSEGHDWWVDFEEKWEHTEIIEFIPVKPTAEQLQRLEEINELGIPDGFGTICSNYVREGIFPEDVNHPLRLLQLQKENELQGIELSEQEIENIEQGQQISELEIHLLMGGI
jgi:hypothetical protein